MLMGYGESDDMQKPRCPDCQNILVFIYRQRGKGSMVGHTWEKVGLWCERCEAIKGKWHETDQEAKQPNRTDPDSGIRGGSGARGLRDMESTVER